MRLLLGLALTGLLLATGVADAGQGRGRGHFKNGSANDNREVAVDRRTVIFSPRDVEIIRGYYGPQYRNLPPGLQKRVARGKGLPPGWQKKVQGFPAALDGRLSPLPGGYHRGIYDGHAVIYDPISHAIQDIVSVF